MMYRIDTKDFAEKVRYKNLAFICEGKFDDLQKVHGRVTLLETLSETPNRLISEWGYVKMAGIILQVIFHDRVDYISLGEEMQWWRSSVFFVQIDERNSWYRIYRTKEMLGVKIYEDNQNNLVW